MRNDFFKHILLSGGSRQNRTELETEVLPYAFNSNGHRLRNYRIYGNTVNGESVGDLVTEGEHTGEYSVSVTISSNLFDGTLIHRSVIGNSVSSDDPNRRSVVIDISSFANGDKITFSRETGVGSVFQMYQVNSPLKGGELLNSNIFSGDSGTLLATITLDNIANYHYLMIFLNGATQPITDEELLASKIMINVGDTALPYEPYHEPITTNIYLPEPLRKIGDEAEYIDFREQKQYRVRENLFDKSHFTQTKLVPNNNILYEDPYTISIILSCTPNTKYTISKIVTNRFRILGCTDYPDVGVQSRLIASGNDNSSLTFTTGNNDNYLLVMIFYQRQADEPTVDDVKNSLIYELYIYTKPDISLPAIPTIDGTNIITVDTETQPRKIYIQGNIEEIETVSAETQALQTNMQSLQPLSLDENSIEEILETENLETTGDDENAE